MLNKLLEQRWLAVTAVLCDKTCTEIADARALKPRDEHWNLVAEILPVFKRLQVATTVMSSEAESSSSIYPILYGL